MATEWRKTGIDVVGDMPWGTHFCHFYETKEDLLDILIPYFKTGLENNEFCMWIVFDPLKEEEARNALRLSMPEADRHIEAGDIEIVPHTQWYLNEGTFDLEWVINGWKEKLAQALARGYDGMRVNGNEAWLTQKEWKDFAEYEKELNELIANQRMIVLCTYPLAVARAAELFDVARTHQFAIAKRHGNWEVVETPELRRSKAEIMKLNEELDQRVIERTRELAATTEELRQEILEHKRSKSALQESEGELRALFGAMMDFVLVLDAEGRYLKIAPTSRLNLYRPPEESLGKKIHEVMHKESADEILHQIRQVLGNNQASNFEFKLNIGSSEVWFDGRVSPFTENMVFLIGRDITDRRRMEEELIRSNNELELTIKALSEQTENLEEVNGALRVLVRQREEDRKELGESVLANVRNLILPYVEKLNQSPLSSVQMTWIKILESHINEITSSFGRTLAAQYANLTSTEIRIATLIRDGRSTAQIAELSGIAERTVCRHRDNIRKKLGLRGGGINLRTHLLNLK